MLDLFQILIEGMKDICGVGASGSASPTYTKEQYEREEDAITRLLNLKIAVLTWNTLSTWMHESKYRSVSCNTDYIWRNDEFDHSYKDSSGNWNDNHEPFEHLTVELDNITSIDEIAPSELLDHPKGVSDLFLTPEAIGYTIEVHQEDGDIWLVWQKEGYETYKVQWQKEGSETYEVEI
jgi:hypothetical protein